MKKLCLLFLFLGALCAVQAQNKYVKLIDAGHYEKAESKINRKLEKEPTDMEILFAKSYLLSARAYKGHDAYRAYQTMVRVYNQYLQLDAKGWAKLNKAHINDSTIAVCMDTLSAQLCEDAQPSHRISAYQLFVNVYKRAHPRYTDQAEAQRCHLVYQEALKQNTEAAFRDFVRIYPYAKDAGKAWDHICDFELAKAENPEIRLLLPNIWPTILAARIRKRRRMAITAVSWHIRRFLAVGAPMPLPVTVIPQAVLMSWYLTASVP
jgi:tetratricopeptide (TPR) repeat protein